jgi:stage III sporulation protein SpoIIIAA
LTLLQLLKQKAYYRSKRKQSLKAFLKAEICADFVDGSSTLVIPPYAQPALRSTSSPSPPKRRIMLVRPTKTFFKRVNRGTIAPPSLQNEHVTSCVKYCHFHHDRWQISAITTVHDLKSLLPSLSSGVFAALCINYDGPRSSFSNALVAFQWTADQLIVFPSMSNFHTALSTFQVLEICLRSVNVVAVHDAYQLPSQIRMFCKFVDTQLIAEHITGDALTTLPQLKNIFHQYYPPHNNLTARANMQPPLPPNMLQLMKDVELVFHFAAQTRSSQLHLVLNMLVTSSQQRIANAQVGRAVCFQAGLRYAMISAELPRHSIPTTASDRSDDYNGQLVQMHCDLSSLLSLLPERFTRRVLDDEHLYAELEQTACDFVLDFGRRGFWTSLQDSSRHFLSSDDRDTVTSELLDSICQHLEFGRDNRAVLDNQLHRISCIRNKQQDIVALTLRVGRYFTGSSYMLSDILHHPKFQQSSILVLGVPGSGKTSLIREIARIIAMNQNVCIVDKSNEICGDGNTPHHCVGNARRLMVSDLSSQHQVMIECVQNHTPNVMVIDEIDRVEEVKAAHTVKQRGVRLIASAHGDFRSLLKNQELNRLLGGVQSVTVGDIQAQLKASIHLSLSILNAYRNCCCNRMVVSFKLSAWELQPLTL